MKGFILVAAVVLPIISGPALAEMTLAESDRVLAACPEAWSDAVKQKSEKWQNLRERKKTGDPRTDGKMQCEMLTALIQFLEVQIQSLKSCQPTTELLIGTTIKFNERGQMSAAGRMIAIGCK